MLNSHNIDKNLLKGPNAIMNSSFFLKIKSKKIHMNKSPNRNSKIWTCEKKIEK